MLFVHAGTPKTGTKALQAFLGSQSKKLAKQGILYLESGRQSDRRHRLAYRHSALVKSLWDRSRREIWTDVRAELESSTCHTNVISAEGFWFSDPAELRAELPKSQQVRVVFYFRRQDQYLQSLWKQALVGGRKHTFNEWRRTLPTRGDYLSTVDKWADLFGSESVLIRPYEKQGKINTIDDFCEVIGVTGFADTENTGRNPSPRRELAHLIRAFNHLDLEIDRHRLFRAIVARSENYTRTCDMLTYAECVTLMEEHAESNRTLIERYYRGATIPFFPELSPFEPGDVWHLESEELFQLATDVLEVMIEFAASGQIAAGGSVTLADDPKEISK